MELQALAAALEGNETVEKVWLSGNKVGDRGVQVGGVGGGWGS